MWPVFGLSVLSKQKRESKRDTLNMKVWLYKHMNGTKKID